MTTKQAPIIPFNFRALCKDAKAKLVSFGYEQVFSVMSDSSHETKKFGIYFSKWDHVQEKKTGSTWLNYLTVDSILAAKDESELLQIEHI